MAEPLAGTSSSEPEEDVVVEMDSMGCLSRESCKKFHNAYSYWWKLKTDFRRKSDGRKRAIAEGYALRRLEFSVIAKRITQFCFDRQGWRHLEEALLKTFSTPRAKEENDPVGIVKDCESVLVTYHFPNEWGAEPLAGGAASVGPCPLPAAEVSEGSSEQILPFAAKGGSDSGIAGSPSLDPEAGMKKVQSAAEDLQMHPKIHDVWAELTLVARAIAKDQRAHVAWALELCGRTYLRTGELRVHAHVAAVTLSRAKFRFDANLYKVAGQPPGHAATPDGRVLGRQRHKTSALTYLLMPKVGGIFCEGTLDLHSDLPVQPQTVFAALQSGKLFCHDARALLRRSPRGIQNNLACVDRYYQELALEAIERVRQWRRSRMQQLQRPWRRFRAVEAWREQYRHVMPRYKFLVLDGPSRLGKTEFVRGLLSPDEFLEVNASGGQELDLRGFRVHEHRLVLFDEAGPEQVLRHKKLLQAGGEPVQLQTSATNMYAYSTFVAGVMFVIATNTWMDRCRLLCAGDQEWLASNCFYLKVDSCMWVEPLADSARLERADTGDSDP
jgi:hypothetical protein